MLDFKAARHVKPRTKDHLWNWVKGYTGIEIARESVCEGHSAPFDMFAQQFLERPDAALWHGPRGSGKSFLSALDTHLCSRFDSKHATRILGGSKAQSAQIYEAIKEIVLDGHGDLGNDQDRIQSLLAESASYRNGSHVSILAASPRSVRGPHVQSLKLDEVDEIDDKLRNDALGMAMEKHGHRASVLMTSTWHKPGGAMSSLIEKGKAGAFPVHTYCVFEVLERCPEERSGPNLENCPSCPLVDWCHSDRDSHPSGLPKAKRSDGHYTIDSLAQKITLASARVFKSDYLCQGPQVDGVWFSRFDESRHVTTEAEYDPSLPVHVSIDSGVWTGAVLLQVREPQGEDRPRVNIFAEHLSYDLGSERAAREILSLIESHCGNPVRRVSTDSAGGAKNPSGIVVIGEYKKVGLTGERGIEFWPKYPGSVIDSLKLTEGFVESADGRIHLTIHPRCRKLIEAFQCFGREKKGGTWVETPKAEQHPHEDMIDPVRGALKLLYPAGRTPEPKFNRVHAKKVF